MPRYRANKHIYLSSPHMSEEGFEQGYIKEAFSTNWIAPVGPLLNEFENKLKEKIGTSACVALSSGTAAIHLALQMAGVQKGDVVFSQSLTFCASANPIRYIGAEPVFIDSEEESFNMSPQALANAFEKYPQAKAVIFVDLYGNMPKIEELTFLCRRYGAVLIEDAAEALGSTLNGKHAGSFGDYGIISFNGNKIITTSGGGALLCNLKPEEAKKNIEKARFLATQANEPARHYQHQELGYNYRMSNVLAGIGLGQMKVLEKRVERKREIYRFYQKAFLDISDIFMLPINEGNCWLSCIHICATSLVKPLDILAALEKANIESRPIWKPMHLQPLYQVANATAIPSYSSATTFLK